jgi:rhodanese-related sulfurtransferase
VKRLLVEAAGVLALATGLALAVNALSPAGIPVLRPLPLTDLDPRYLTPEETRARFEAGRSIFVDARKPEEYRKGRIEAALNLPADLPPVEFQQHYAALAPQLPKETELVVYCGGSDCALSRQLADQLRLYGHEQVKIFRGGWTEWKARGWPSEP